MSGWFFPVKLRILVDESLVKATSEQHKSSILWVCFGVTSAEVASIIPSLQSSHEDPAYESCGYFCEGDVHDSSFWKVVKSSDTRRSRFANEKFQHNYSSRVHPNPTPKTSWDGS